MQENQPTNTGSQGTNGTPSKHLLDQYTAQPAQQEDDSPFYKSAAPQITLPRGGGALKSIDEKFSINAVNGTAGLEIPLPLTPGRNGFTPALTLNYNSGSGNSPFGLGWSLSLPAIQRRTDKKLPRYNDAGESDTFLLAGAEDLIPELDSNGERVLILSGDYTIQRYRPRIEGLFARIEQVRQNGNPGYFWRITTRDNSVTYYGLTVAGRIADPEDPGRIFRWLPELVVDPKGQVQQHTYLAENLDNVPAESWEHNRLNGNAPVANRYLKSVRYGNRTPYFIPENISVYAPPAPVGDWLFEAVFDYGDHSATNYTPLPDQAWPVRPDAFSDYRPGFELRTWRRCHRVLCFHRFDELNSGSPTLVRSLAFTYRNDTLTGPQEADLLLEAVQTGYRLDNGSYRSKSLPPLTLSYNELSWDHRIHAVEKADFRGAPQGLTGPYQWIDFEGEGISGILTEQGTGWFYKNNLGDGRFAGPKSIAEKPNFRGLNSGPLQWQDLDADGRRQIVSATPTPGYWELEGPDAYTDYENKWLPFRPFEKNIKINWDSPFTLRLDLNGDGKPDVLLTEDRAWTWWDNKGTEGMDYGGQAPAFLDEEKGPVLLLRDAVQSIFLADMSGDGLTDLVRIRNGEICYWPNKGYGYFGARVVMQGAPVLGSQEGFNPNYLSLADISGTGAADLLYTGKNQLSAWINLSGNAFGERVDINPLPATNAYSKLAVLDFLGNGTACIVWSSPLPQHAGAPLQYIDLMGGNKPYLLKQYQNGTGKEITLRYKSSTQYYLDDKKQGIRWATKLPFPVHCVQEITTRDTVSQTRYSQQYRYRHGYYDSLEREFRGFGYVETVDTETAATAGSLDQPPVLTKSWYHTGAWIREESLLDRFQQEYFPLPGWDGVIPITGLPQGLAWQAQREAYRALKGSLLRQEIYAPDGTAQETIPYAITATAYQVKEIQPVAENRYGCFLPLQQQTISFSCERDSTDPRLLQELVLETDLYGQPLLQAQVAYPRQSIPGTLPQQVQEEQVKMHITATETGYTNDVIDATDFRYYRLRLPYREKNYEANLAPPDGALYTVAELKGLLDTATEVDFTVVPALGQKRLLSQTRSLFLGDDTLTALPEGTLESLALPFERYNQAFSPEVLSVGYGTRVTPAMLGNGGYIDLDSNGNYWLPSGRTIYHSSPETNFYTPITYRDPWNNETTLSYWSDYWLLPQSSSDALSNVTSIEAYDWHNLQLTRIKDPNGNSSELLYDALGLPVAMALKGKNDGSEGDTLAGIDPDSPADLALQQTFWNDPESAAADLLKGATWRCVYDFTALPVAAGMIAREQHDVDNSTSPLQLRLSYSDGLGRVLMHKAPCEPTLENGQKPWIGGGRTVYNNKGSVVLQYEPYFSATHACDTAEQAALQGVSPKLYYDPLDRNYRTELPDGSLTKTEWTAWQQVVWDNNDTVLESAWYAERIGGGLGPEAQAAAQKAAAHANTPTLIHTDTLARGFYTIQILVPGPTVDNPVEAIHSYENLDIQGNRISVVDGRGLTPLSYVYNMLQLPALQTSIDSGVQRSLVDAAGQPCYTWDADDRRFEISYDLLRRPTEQVMTDTSGTKTLEVYVYGEGQTNDKLNNLRTQLYQHFDGSGKQQIDQYDFKGNPLTTQQQLLDDATITDVDWSGTPALSTEVFTASGTFDALNRPVTATDPGSNVQAFTYDKSGLLKTVTLNSDPYVNDIHYDAKGQRQAIWYGNGTKTSYTYDPETFRLKRLLTVGLTANDILQDLNYWYDPVGNISEIQDDAQQTLFFNNSVVSPTQQFTYDALYRLTEAQGRELIGTADFGSEDNWNDAPWMGQAQPGNGAALQNYTQQYTYDEVGNILSLQHSAGTGSYTRTYDVAATSNRLSGTTVGANTYNYSYDNRGNMLTMPHLSTMAWNAHNELAGITKGSEPTYYQYSTGQRTRKYTNKGTITEERIYLGNYEIYRKFDNSSLTLERTTVHVSDDTGRIALLETRTQGTDPSRASLQRYIYSNHLQSAALELDENAAIISYEEYHPYGTTAYQAMNASINAVAKRYRFCNSERDEESGLYYMGARYYNPWLCRWCAVDAMQGEMPTWSSYNYGFCNPIIFNDPSGNQPEEQQVQIGLKGGIGTADNPVKVDEVVITANRIQYEETGWHFFRLTISEQDSSTVNVKYLDYFDNTMKGSFGIEMDFGSANLIFGFDNSWHIIPEGWLDRNLNEAGSPAEVISMVNSWEDGSSYVSALRTAKSLESIGNTAQAGLGIGMLLGGLTDISGKPVSINLNRSTATTGRNTYDGVQTASKYLQEQGVPRAYRKQILESFEVSTISLRTADNATFGLRFHGGAANRSGRYLFPTFTNYTNRAGLALPTNWNSMSGISQFQIAPGSTYIFGRAASQSRIYSGGSYQIYINNLNNLIN